jgi:AcrR family transcriptional regulator
LITYGCIAITRGLKQFKPEPKSKKSLSKHITTPERDGRHQRTERSRTALINAARALINAGVLIATAQQIANRAEVGIRTFFSHFDDMSELPEAVSLSIRDNYEVIAHGGDRSGTIEQRIQRAVENRIYVYEQNYNVILSTLVQRWRLNIVKKNHARNQRGLRKDLGNWLAELKKMTTEQREAINTISSFDMWHRLRDHQGLGITNSIHIITNMLHGLLKAP